jgi:putative transposase
VNRSGYYAYKNSPPTMRETDDERLTALIVKSFNESNRNYGTARIQADLRDWGEKISRRRITFRRRIPILQHGATSLVPIDPFTIC